MKLAASGSIVRLNISIKVDLTAFEFLTIRVTNPTEDDDGKLQRVLKYLRGTQEIGLVLDGRQGIILEVFVDSTHAVYDDDTGHSEAIAHTGNAC